MGNRGALESALEGDQGNWGAPQGALPVGVNKRTRACRNARFKNASIWRFPMEPLSLRAQRLKKFKIALRD